MSDAIDRDDAVDILRVLRYASEVFGDAEVAREWMRCKVPALSGSRPVDLLNTIHGRNLVCDVLGKNECGEFS